MAGNYGKFVDKFPAISAAGLAVGDPKDSVSNTLKEYSLEDLLILKENPFVPPRKLPPIRNAAFIPSEITSLLNPPVKTRYQALIADLKDTTYNSYWNTEIGKPRDATLGLPAGMNQYETTFGKPTTKETPLSELVNPSKGPYQVLRESQDGHDMYKMTHNNYYPGEKINRRYNKPPYNPDKCFGHKTKYDSRGIWAYCALDWQNKEPLSVVSKLESDYIKRNKSEIGKCFAPNENALNVPLNFAYGVPIKKDFYQVQDLLKDVSIKPNVFKKKVLNWVSALNKFRIFVKRRVKKDEFDLKTFRKSALNLDTENKGTLPIQTFYSLCACKDLTFPKRELEALMEYLEITKDNEIDYAKFIDMIDYNKDPPKIALPPESQHFITSSQAATFDYRLIDNSKHIPAGIPSIRYDRTSPIKPEGGCRADLENLGNETTAKIVLNPSIYGNFGLNYRDFFVPRSRETLKTLFEKVGYKFKEDDFEKLWEKGVKLDETGLVCVDTFKKLISDFCEHPLLHLDS